MIIIMTLALAMTMTLVMTIAFIMMMREDCLKNLVFHIKIIRGDE
jgi:hypothetical protein